MRVERSEMNLTAHALAVKPDIRLTRLKHGEMNVGTIVIDRNTGADA
jgi:hypothetical protein